jgi:hypothetical protein
VESLRGVRAAILQEQKIPAVRERLGEGIEEEWEHGCVSIGQFQEATRASDRDHGAIDVEPFEDVLNCPHGLDSPGSHPTSAHGEEAKAAFSLAAYPHGSGVGGWDDARQPLLTGRLERRHRRRLLLCDGGAALWVWPESACAPAQTAF